MKKSILIMLSASLTLFWACDEATENSNQEVSANRLIAVPATADESADPANTKVPVISFEEMEYNFGEINMGDEVEHVFKFTNTGEGPLIINSADASCGCTAPDWPKEPIEPGNTGEIFVKFDSKGKSGVQNKSVTITANTQPSQTTLMIKGSIKSPKAEEANS